MEQPQISIITPVFNNLKGLKVTYQSLLDQNFDNFQWIIVDSISTDGTKEFVDSLEFEQLVFISEKDKGITDAFNKGLERVSGQYILFLSGDDLLADNALQMVSEAMVKNNCPDFIYGDGYFHHNNKWQLKQSLHHSKIWYGQFTFFESMYFNASKVKSLDLKFDLKYPLAGDYYFTFKFLTNTTSRHYIHAPLAYFQSGGWSYDNWKTAIKQVSQVRRLHKINWLVNLALVNVQLLVGHIRNSIPGLYELLRFKVYQSKR